MNPCVRTQNPGQPIFDYSNSGIVTKAIKNHLLQGIISRIWTLLDGKIYILKKVDH